MVRHLPVSWWKRPLGRPVNSEADEPDLRDQTARQDGGVSTRTEIGENYMLVFLTDKLLPIQNIIRINFTSAPRSFNQESPPPGCSLFTVAGTFVSISLTKSTCP